MNRITVVPEDVPEYAQHLIKGSDLKGFYLPDTQFNRLLLSPSLPEKTEYEKIDGLYDFQSEVVNQMKIGNLLTALSPGMGKTVVVSKYLQIHKPGNVMIIAPKALHYVWEEHLQEYVGIQPQVRKIDYSGGYAVTNHQQLTNIKFYKYPDVVFVDESILYKNRKSKAYKLLKKLSERVKRVYLLSGSPYSKDISDLWAQLNILFPKDFPSYWNFGMIFCDIHIDRYGWRFTGNKKGSEELLKKTLWSYVYFAHIDDHITLPEQTEIIIKIDPSDLQHQISINLEEGFSHNGIDVNGKLALITRLKQTSLSPILLGETEEGEKLRSLYELLDVIEYPSIVCSSSNIVLDYLHQQYNNSTLFNADNPNYSQYISGEKDLMFMQLASGKFGHSFTNTRTLIYLDYTFNSDDLYQSLARVKRITTKHTVTIYHLLCMKIDYIMYKHNKRKNISIDTVLREYLSDH